MLFNDQPRDTALGRQRSLSTVISFLFSRQITKHTKSHVPKNDLAISGLYQTYRAISRLQINQGFPVSWTEVENSTSLAAKNGLQDVTDIMT